MVAFGKKQKRGWRSLPQALFSPWKWHPNSPVAEGACRRRFFPSKNDVPFGILVIFCHIWSYLIIFYHMLSYLIIFAWDLASLRKSWIFENPDVGSFWKHYLELFPHVLKVRVNLFQNILKHIPLALPRPGEWVFFKICWKLTPVFKIFGTYAKSCFQNDPKSGFSKFHDFLRDGNLQYLNAYNNFFFFVMRLIGPTGL